MKRLVVLVCAAVFGIVSNAGAHVTVWPRESQPGAREKYVVRVPAEDVATTGVEIEIPEGVVVMVVGAPVGWTYEIKRSGDRITAIMFRMNIKAGEFAEFPFVAMNPQRGPIIWKAHQYTADGTSRQCH